MSDLEGWSKHIDDAGGSDEDNSESTEKMEDAPQQHTLKIYTGKSGIHLKRGNRRAV